MKKNVLALSIATMIGGLGFAGAASAQLAVNDSGIGHILINPYYTAQNNFYSVLHVVNTDTVNGKAVKVRFRGASNSDDVLDFQVFMSPGDVWTAAIVKGADDIANLVTQDGTCTLPAIAKGQMVPFLTDRLPPAMTDADKASNTREGYVEIFNMADIDGSKQVVYGGPGNVVPVNSPLYTATKHVNGVAPCTDAVLQSTLVTGRETAGLLAPSAGLVGTWYLIDVAQTLTFSGPSTTIVATDETRNVFSPQVSGAAPTGLSADPLFKAGILTAQKYDLPDLSTPYTQTVTNDQAGADDQADNLTNLIARRSVINQYANDAPISAKTDWVFSMPTRRYSIAANYAATMGQGSATTAGYGALSADDRAKAYRVINSDVNSFFKLASNTKVNSIGQICVSSIGFTFFDREEASKKSGAVFSPGTVTNTPLCGEVSVLSFNDPGASSLNAQVARTDVTGAYTNGWGQIFFDNKSGVPILGAAFLKLHNPNAMPGVSGNYGITWPHAYTQASRRSIMVNGLAK